MMIRENDALVAQANDHGQQSMVVLVSKHDDCYCWDQVEPGGTPDHNISDQNVWGSLNTMS